MCDRDSDATSIELPTFIIHREYQESVEVVRKCWYLSDNWLILAWALFILFVLGCVFYNLLRPMFY